MRVHHLTLIRAAAATGVAALVALTAAPAEAQTTGSTTTAPTVSRADFDHPAVDRTVDRTANAVTRLNWSVNALNPAVSPKDQPGHADRRPPENRAGAHQMNAVSQDMAVQDDNEWVLSGYVGPNFGDDVHDANTAFGGAVSYLYDRTIGGEVLANFTPNFSFAPATMDDQIVDSYMVNGVAALPMGDRGAVQPFVSGGVGVLTIHGDRAIDDPADLVAVDDSQLGGNVGVGVMAFDQSWGFRAALRYFAGFDDSGATNPSDLLDPADLLGDTSFFQFNAGVSYRF